MAERRANWGKCLSLKFDFYLFFTIIYVCVCALSIVTCIILVITITIIVIVCLTSSFVLISFYLALHPSLPPHPSITAPYTDSRGYVDHLSFRWARTGWWALSSTWWMARFYWQKKYCKVNVMKCNKNPYYVMRDPVVLYEQPCVSGCMWQPNSHSFFRIFMVKVRWCRKIFVVSVLWKFSAFSWNQNWASLCAPPFCRLPMHCWGSVWEGQPRGTACKKDVRLALQEAKFLTTVC